MNELIIKGTASTPEINFSTDGNLMIQGYSLPEDTIQFYQPVFDWIQQYIDESHDKLRLTFKFVYFNTSTAKIIVDLLRTIKKGMDESSIEINWLYDEEDEDMKDVALRLEEIVELKFTLIQAES